MRRMNSNPQTINLPRRRLLGALACAVATALVPFKTRASEATIAADVWKGPTCGCCNDWITHLEANGFSVTAYNEGNSAARARLGMPLRFGSCHTADIGGYAIEGHVPAREIHRLLEEQPDAVGLTVPGMPIGSPGMDGSVYGGRRDPYDVLLIGRDGSARVYQSYR